MYPELPTPVGDYVIGAYWLAYLAAGACFLLACLRWARRLDLAAAGALDLALLYAWGMTAGATLCYDALHGGHALRAFSAGGLLEGGLFAGPAVVVLLATAYPVVFRASVAHLDAACLSLPLALAVAKVGCFLNGCCYGAENSGAPAVTFPEGSAAPAGVPRHPTQLYDALLLVVTGLVLGWLYRRSAVKRGWTAPWFVLLFCAGRFMTVFTRGDMDGAARVGPLLASQLHYVAGMVGAVLLITFVPALWQRWIDWVGRRKTPSTPPPHPPIGLRRRLVAELADLALVAAMAGAAAAFGWGWQLGAAAGILADLVAVPAWRGATVGVLIAGARMATPAGRPSLWAIALRGLVFLPSVGFVLGLARMFADDRRRCFHDALSGVDVIPARETPPTDD